MFRTILLAAAIFGFASHAFAQTRAEVDAELIAVSAEIKTWEARKTREQADWTHFQQEVDAFNKRSDGISARKKQQNELLDRLRKVAASNCTNKDVLSSSGVKCVTPQGGKHLAQAVFDLSDAYLAFRRQTAALEKTLRADFESLNRRADEKRSAAKETSAKLKSLRAHRTTLRKKLASLKATRYSLTPRTAQKLKEFRDLQADFAEMQKLGNTLIALAPFRTLLGGASPETPVEIANESWEALGTASKGLASHYRAQLKFFCQTEALSSQNNTDEKRFWEKMASRF